MKIHIIFLCVTASLFACSNHDTEKNVIDSLSKTEKAEEWPPAAPDTAALRKNSAVVEIITNMGRMEVALFNATPKHRDNFLKLVKNGYYDGLLFHRVMKEFMIQGGDPESKGAKPSAPLGQGGPGYTLEKEFVDTFYHLRGALAAARLSDEGNPEKNSSGSQFYIVSGSLHNSTKLRAALKERAILSFMSNPENMSYQLRAESYQNRQDMAAMNVLLQEIETEIKPIWDSLYNSYSPRTRQLYATWGGFPKLDKEYTVFGQLLSGYDVLDKIQNAQTGSDDRPVRDIIIIQARVIKDK